MAAELVGGALLSASLQYLFERIGSPEVLAYLRGKSKRSDFDELLRKFKTALKSVTAVLDDAEQKQMRNKSVEIWIEELQDAFYDADDLLDEIETDALQLKEEAESTATSRKVFKSKKEKIRNFFSRSSNSKARDMNRKIEKILERLEEIKGQKDFLGLKEGVVGERSSWRPLPSTSLVDESGVYGRDDDTKEMIKLLLSDDVGNEKITVISIVGMGGIGKTTLAQAVFNDDRIKEHFETKAWVCVSEDFDVFRITKTVLAAVSGISCDDAMDLNSLQVKLKETLSGKKFLIVLDDVWNEKYVDWVVMRLPFKDGAQGSKIIVTTRSEEVASVMGTHAIPTHRLKELDEEVCWQLFTKHAFGSDDFSPHPDLERIGRKIVKKCKGLPLAAKTLGGLLRSKLDIEHWERISQSDIWELTDERSDILPALKLSYHYLPSHLKRCFAYCSIFPKDFEFQKEEMVLLWMAENLLEHPKGNIKRIEEVGSEYFNDLVSRSFFQRSGIDRSHYVIHDLMNDLAKFVSGKYCRRLEDSNTDEILTKTRHLACATAMKEERLKLVSKATHLRTFIMLNYCIISEDELFLKLRYLRVLSLSFPLITQLPDSIGRELRHLRYLDLSFSSINMLPESVCMLYNLQTLKLYDCRELTKLPTDFHRLVNLRYLDVGGTNQITEMPTQMGKLKSLQRLSTFIVGRGSGTRIGELGELSDLRGKLHIQNLQNIVEVEDASEAKLRDKKYLEELEFEWAYKTNNSEHERDVLDHLLPGTTLKKLQIVRYGGFKFPNWLGDQLFNNIVDIYLSRCTDCNSLPPLGQLPSLKYLEILNFHGVSRVGSEFFGNSSSFASLEILEFSAMLNWEEWSIPFDDAEAFPNLRRLSISNCEKLTGDLPRFLPSLTELFISYCPLLASPLPAMPVVSTLSLVYCGKLSGYDVFGSFSCLQHLRICKSLASTTCRSLPTTLKKLDFNGCEKIEFPLLHSCYLPNLTELHIKYCGKFITSGMSWNSRRLPNLTRLTIWKCKFENSYDSFPKEGLLPTTITKLGIYYLDWLKTLNSKGLQQLTALTSLSVNYCRNLHAITNEGLPPSLQHLKIDGCPLLEEKCEREKGECWNKISYVPEIYFNGELIS